MAFKRRFKNYLLFPGAQLKHGLMFVGVSTVLHVGLSVLAIIFVDSWLSGKAGVGAMPFWQVAAAIIFLYIVFLIFIFAFGLFISHKWLGPLVPIERFLTLLVGGNYSQRLSLRKNDVDHLNKIVASLNDLANQMENKSRDR